MSAYQNRIEIARAVVATGNTLVLLGLSSWTLWHVCAGGAERVVWLLPSLALHAWAERRLIRFYLNRHTAHP